MPLDVTPGGLVLPQGLSTINVLPGLAGSTIRGTQRGAGGVRLTPESGHSRGLADGPLINYQGIYDGQPVLRAIVDKISTHFSRVPWLTERWVEGAGHRRGRYELVEDDHPAVRLLQRPAPGFGPMALKQWIAMDLLIQGDFAGVMHRDLSGMPIELYPFNRAYLAAYGPRGGMVSHWVTHEAGVSQVYFDADVLHVAAWSGSGSSGQIGISPFETLGVTIVLENAAQRHTIASLNGAHPGGSFELPEGVDFTPELAEQLRVVVDSFRGVDEAGSVPVTARGAKWVTHAQTAKDAALIETRHRNAEEFCAMYDTTPVAIGLLRDGSQRGNVDALDRRFYTGTLAGKIDLACEAINVQLLGSYQPWVDERLRVRKDLTEFLRGDPVQWETVQNNRLLNGRRTLNETRDEDGVPRYENELADEPWVQDNNSHPISMAAKAVEDAATGDVAGPEAP